jgi:hypothetical protein
MTFWILDYGSETHEQDISPSNFGCSFRQSKIQNPKSKSGPADENGWVKGEEEKAR